ncbi:CocE/NonD family hydrolase [Streptomyces sp. NPDC002785]|uniref:CocE/NonD family hydrolase n=1 Tax=Streptomyces sp. NPDC002785 TaxID=3154543 RepID=UPI00332B9B29
MRIVVEHDLEIPLRDGTVLQADLYRPDSRASLPTLIRRTPYGRAGEPAGPGLDTRRLLTAGYGLLVQDIRGRGSSGGEFEPFWAEGADGADTVDWAAAQPWCDGRVGMLGRSYEGSTALLAAGRAPQALHAVSAHMAGSEFREGWCYQGGVFQLGFVLHWALADLLLPGVLAAGPGNAGAAQRVLDALDSIEDLYRTPDLAWELLDELVPYVRRWREHPRPGPYWLRAAPNRTYPAMRAAGLHIGGWYDIFLGGTLENYAGGRRHGGSAAAREHATLVVGPWSHCIRGGVFPGRRYGVRADDQVLDVTGLHIEHFDRTLKGTGGPPAERVRIFLTGADRWQTFPDWPVPDVSPVALYLTSGARHANSAAGDGALFPGRPPAAGSDRFLHDPGDPVPTAGGATLMTGMFVGADCGPQDQRAVERRADVLCYTGAPQTAALTVVGEVTLVVHVSCSGPATDIAAKLVDVSPDGRAEILCDGIRAGYAECADGPRLPGRTVEVTVRLGAVGHVFAPGHRVRLEVAGSNFPRFEVNPGTGGDPAEPWSRPCEMVATTLHHGRSRPSHLLLPVLTTSR